MSKSNWSVQNAKNSFGAVIDAARHEPQIATKHGTPAVVVVDAAEYERLRHLERANAPSFAELLLALPQDNGEFPRLKSVPATLSFVPDRHRHSFCNGAL